MKKRMLLILFGIYSLSVSAYEWKAWWISTDACQSEPNTWLNYRKTVDLQQVPPEAMAKIAADSKYWLWINNELVVFEGGLKRGPNPQDTYFDEIDIAPFLKTGKNTIAILVCYFGKQGFSHNSSGKAGLLFDCQAQGLEIISDNTWGCIINPAYQTCVAPKPNYRLSESSILYDARRDVGNWFTSHYKVGMPGASQLQKAGGAPWNNLVKRPIPQWKNSGLQHYKNEYRKGDTLICELPYNAQITPYMKIKSVEGIHITIATDNYFYYNGATENIRAQYITRNGEQQYESLGWINGHKVYYLLPKDVEVLEVGYRETGYNTEFAGSFHSSDPFLNTLWEKSRRTLYLTMRDSYMDCPERERAQWTGDAVNQSGESFYALSSSSHSLAAKWLEELAAWQKPNGSIYAPVPAGNWNTELPGQTLASIGYYGAYNYYMHTGDKKTISHIYPSFKKYLELWQTNADGTIMIRPDGWLWGDWGNHRDMEPIINAWYYLAIKAMHLFAQEMDYRQDVAIYGEQLKNINAAFNKQFWNGVAYRDPKYNGKTDDRVQALAVVSGLADEVKYPFILNVFQQEYHASPYMEKYVFEAMMMMGKEKEAIKRHKERMYSMVVDPYFTTLWEHWDVKASGFTSGTINHSWTGGGLTVLSQYVCGISPAMPGYQTVCIAPQPADLENAAAELASVNGLIKSSFSNTAKVFQLKIETPPTMECIIGVPALNVKKIVINNIEVWSKGKFIPNTVSTALPQGNSSHIRFGVLGGKYEIKATK